MLIYVKNQMTGEIRYNITQSMLYLSGYDIMKGGLFVQIIHVDMNRYALQAMQKELPQIVPGADLHCFDRPDPALAFAEARGCDVLLTEIEFWNDPHGGVRLARAMKEINPRFNIIFVTVYSESEIARELSGLPVSGFFPKPWATEKLAAAFQNLR